MRFEVITIIFWDVTPCSLVIMCLTFQRNTFCCNGGGGDDGNGGGGGGDDDDDDETRKYFYTTLVSFHLHCFTTHARAVVRILLSIILVAPM